MSVEVTIDNSKLNIPIKKQIDLKADVIICK